MNETAVQKFLRSEISFYITVVSAVVAIAGFYFGISNQINLLAEKMDNHIKSTSEIPTDVEMLREKVAVLESKSKTQ